MDDGGATPSSYRGRIVMKSTGRRRISGLFVCAALLAVAASVASGQITYSRGQNIAPSFEGWMPNPDGTIEIRFGYFNRNFEEHLHLPVGPDNNIEPGGPDLGQPTWFLPRRNLNAFSVTVPGDFGDREIVWTLTANGKTEQAYASLIPEFILDQRVIYRQYTGFDVQGETEHNQIPTVRVAGAASRQATAGEPLALTAVVADDGIPAPQPARGGPFQGQRARPAYGVVRVPR